MSKRPTVIFRPNADGTQNISITFRGVKLRPTANSEMWWMLSYENVTKQAVNCEGMAIRPKLVVKLYAKVPQKQLSAFKKQRVWKSIRSRSPLILT